MCYDKSKIDYILRPEACGKGEPILTYEIAIKYIQKLNKEYPYIYHTYNYESTNGLYFIEWKSRNKNNDIFIKI
jgi:hypothetical protein